ncbi:MAG: serine hydrolase [Clostridia bacterium]|nr:serine hydrolase [Clostridia bacterium]
MKYITPESAGVKSENIEKYIEILKEQRLATHNIIMAKGDSIFFEKYWAPFHKDFLHRMYSVSKSFVAIAIGFLEQDGLISLDDKIIKYFPEESKNQTDENMRNQTIRHMLMMATAKPTRDWFSAKPKDRVKFYFENDREESRPSGTIFDYDSEGSFVLGALAERITGKPFMEYLREKLFSKIGVSEDAYCLKCPGGHSWGDSAVLCKPTDLLKVALFVMRKGNWNGEQILSEEYLSDAAATQIFNNYWDTNAFNAQGYGYKFWKTYDDAFFFNGMGCQFAVCVPQKDMILIYNGDNQGKENVRQCIVADFMRLIVNASSENSIEENPQALKSLEEKTSDLMLIATDGERKSDFEEEINGVTYVLDKNPMGITRFRLVFEENGGKFEYTNAQGNKVITFGRCENAFSPFPQEGYADEIGTVQTKDMYYNCAASASWVEKKKIYIKVQIIDKYFGNMGITIGFRDNVCGIYMNKIAEDFLNEYAGFAGGKRS